MEKNPKKNRPSYEGMGAFAGLPIQMGIIIFLGVWIGKKLDSYFQITPILTLLFALLSVALAIYILIIKTKPKK